MLQRRGERHSPERSPARRRAEGETGRKDSRGRHPEGRRSDVDESMLTENPFRHPRSRRHLDRRHAEHHGHLHHDGPGSGGRHRAGTHRQPGGPGPEDKAPMQRLADKVARYFVLAVAAVAILTFSSSGDSGTAAELAARAGERRGRPDCGMPVRTGTGYPMSMMVASGKAASLGILFRDAASWKPCTRWTPWSWINRDPHGRQALPRQRHHGRRHEHGQVACPMRLPGTRQRTSHCARLRPRERGMKTPLDSVAGLPVLPRRGCGRNHPGSKVSLGTGDMMQKQGVDISSPGPVGG